MLINKIVSKAIYFLFPRTKLIITLTIWNNINIAATAAAEIATSLIWMHLTSAWAVKISLLGYGVQFISCAPNNSYAIHQFFISRMDIYLYGQLL